MKKVCWLFNSKRPNRIWAIVFREKLTDMKNRERKHIAEQGKIVIGNKDKKKE